MRPSMLMRLLVTFPALLLLAMSTAEAQLAKPNVVLMLADNLGYGDLSVYNGGIRGGMRTPNIDRLASQGMRLTQLAEA